MTIHKVTFLAPFRLFFKNIFIKHSSLKWRYIEGSRVVSRKRLREANLFCPPPLNVPLE